MLSKQEEDLREREETERKQLRRERLRVARYIQEIRFADFMAILMVAATAFSGYAAWKNAQVTSQIFLIADRPYLGVESVKFENSSANPAIVVDYRNFGTVSAAGSLVRVVTLVGGKPVKPIDGELSSVEQGIVSPGVPHFFYSFIGRDDYARVMTGTDRAMVEIKMDYKGPESRHRYCYSQRFVYEVHSATFRHIGGTDKCDDTAIF
ncbi:MAG TPA: hypothetical protein VEF03_07265 [Candidatus Binataceae bacterium]|nr:hypothetical protein [Candidatus Binataceae bacterium]